MRVLTVQEVETVSGAGLFRDLSGWAGEKSGGFIGQTIGLMITIPVLNMLVTPLARFVGKKIGGFIGNAFGTWVESLFDQQTPVPA